MDELGDIHDLQGDLVSSHIGGHGSHTLLTGRDDRLGAGGHDLLDFSFGDGGRQLRIDHLQVPAAAAALTILTISREFYKPHTRYRSDHPSRFIEHPGPSPQIAGVVIGDGQRERFQGDPLSPDEFHQVLGGVGDLKLPRIKLPPHLIAGRTRKNDPSGPLFTHGLQIVVGKGFE